MVRTDSALFFGRVLIASIFVVSGVSKAIAFDQSVQHLAAAGLPAPQALLLVATVTEIIGGVALLAGFLAPYAALLLFVYLIPVTLIMHNFWDLTGMQRQMQQISFLKNLAIMGGLICAAVAGAGALSVDRKLGRRSPRFARIYRPLRPVQTLT